MKTEYFILYVEYTNTIGDITLKIPIQQEVFVDSNKATKKYLSMQMKNPDKRFFIEQIIISSKERV